MDKAFPMLLFPAFRMQKNLMMHTLGQAFWEGRRNMLAEGRDKERRETEKLRLLEEKRREMLRQKEIRRKMGFLQYYVCFPRREKYKVQARARTKKETQAEQMAKMTKDKGAKDAKATEAGKKEAPASPGGSRRGQPSSPMGRKVMPVGSPSGAATLPPGFGQATPGSEGGGGGSGKKKKSRDGSGSSSGSGGDRGERRSRRKKEM